jgi:hypothetical protein
LAALALIKTDLLDLAQYCQLCEKVADVTLGSDFTHTIVTLSISQLPVTLRKPTEPNEVFGVQGSGV